VQEQERRPAARDQCLDRGFADIDAFHTALFSTGSNA
jgi:hypothetical protein